jgi:N-carbamoylputrescine amidase
VSVNRCGHEGDPDGGIEFWGQSFVADPAGNILAQAGSESAEVLVVACDLQRIEERRVHWPLLRDRRIDAYGELERRYIDD